MEIRWHDFGEYEEAFVNGNSLRATPVSGGGTFWRVCLVTGAEGVEADFSGHVSVFDFGGEDRAGKTLVKAKAKAIQALRVECVSDIEIANTALLALLALEQSMGA